MKPIEINEFVLPKEGMNALEGWLVRISHIGQRIGIERLLAKSDGGIYQGIIIPYGDSGVQVMKDGVIKADMAKNLESGIYVHGVPVTLHKKGKLWISELAKDGSFLIPFEKEAIALLDDQDR